MGCVWTALYVGFVGTMGCMNTEGFVSTVGGPVFAVGCVRILVVLVQWAVLVQLFVLPQSVVLIQWAVLV